MMLTFLASMGLGVFLGVRMCRACTRANAFICREIDSAQADPTVDEVLDEIERLNVPERDIKIYPRWQIVEPGKFTL